MSYEGREPSSRRYDEEEERYNRSADRQRYESSRYLREPSRSEYGGREYGREREYQSFGRDPYVSRDPYQSRSETPISSGWQRGSGGNAILIRLSDTDFDIPDQDDARGRTVIDQHGNDMGDVNDLIIDPQQGRVRFLLVTSGGFLGIGSRMMLIPIDAISRVTNKVVAIDQQSPRGFRSSVYNPRLIDRGSERDDYGDYESYRNREYPRHGYGYGYSGSSWHRGRGPRGYRRSDERIREDINDRLSDRPDLDASNVEVAVSNCEVVLTGTVNSRRDKRLAEDIAENVSGVQNIENRLRVNQPQFGTSTDRYDVVTSPTSERPNTEPATGKAPASRGQTTGT
jgi:sporulation protein YlmC with PRC-barrel domain